MKKIAYYISDYGFGHGARSVAVIRRLLEWSKDVHLTVCTSYSLPFIKRSLGDDNQQVGYRHVENDIGFRLLPNSVLPDVEGFREDYFNYIERSSSYIEQEKQFLLENEIDLVIGDIPPFPFVAAKEANIPSIGISNFSWYTVYKDWLSPSDLSVSKEAYECMDLFIELAGSQEPHWGKSEPVQVDFFSRHIDQERVSDIRKQIDPTGTKHIVYFGLGMKIQVDLLQNLPIWQSPNCLFIVASNAAIEGDHVFKIPIEDTETQNYIAAADLVISKPGWGTLSEAIQGHVPLLIINRSTMIEDQNNIRLLQDRDRCALINWEDFKQFTLTDTFLAEVKQQAHIQTADGEQELDKIAKTVTGWLK
ncbi:glycosyltransferase [Pullulanibacillus sp. KACC 23026]|uniref:glycosyltransferase n=1 Tax=Pullulanibacillus sp. KACC 23026 TaxID=3028315 RepID=UPI0023AFACA9|nr:glycosyltransferase [Pullulanibacillus sp. KACC 23026]WEG13426.1 glycosyltransferase [Pullulanibacillus sp. KACC 23026]